MDNLPTDPQPPLGSQLPPVQPIAQPSQQFPSQPTPTTFPPQPEVVTQPVSTNPISQSPKSSKKLIIIALVIGLVLIIAICGAVFFITRSKTVQDTNEKSNLISKSDSSLDDKSSSEKSQESGVENQASQAPDLGILYDVPSLINKTKQEVYSILGEPNNGISWYNYDNDWSISVYYDLDSQEFRYISVSVPQDPYGIVFKQDDIYKALNLSTSATEYFIKDNIIEKYNFISAVSIYPTGSTDFSLEEYE